VPTRILAGVDGSPGSRDAAALAATLGDALGARVEVVGVYRDPRVHLPVRRHHDAGAVAAMEAAVSEVRDACAPGAAVRVLSDHSAARGLQRAAETDGATLLVVGSSEGGDEGCVHAGRGARQTMRSASCPVLVAARGAAASPAVERVVVGIDATEESQLALAFAHELASAAGAQLHAVAVVDDRFPVSHVPGGAIIDLADWEQIVAADREHRRALLDRLVPAAAGVSSELREGDPTDVLVSAAVGADLLVVGSRRWGRLSRVVLGSTSEDLVVLAPCSVLVVPRPDAESQPELGEATQDERDVAG
jgi:nucleotide-binding universal stress UspA family protein